MEILNTIWQYVLPIGGGVTLGALIIGILVPVVKGTVSKLIERINVEKIEEKAVNAGVEKIKTMSFKQSIAPLVKSELVKVVEVVDDKLNEKLDEVDKRYSEIVNILSKLSAYFDNSIAVSEPAKQELREALADAAKTSNNADVDIGVAVEQTEAEKPAEEEKTASPTVMR